MKRVGFLYERLVSIENCKAAIMSASKRKRRRKVVQTVLANIDYYAEDLSARLISHDFVTPYKQKRITDGLSGKERDILVPAWYPDQCAHHAIVRLIQPIIEKSSYHWSCANIPKRGIDHASKCIERGTKRDIKNAKYCAKGDVRKYYPSIDHDILKAMLERKIKDKKFLEVVNVVIDSCDEGLPIGNYTSPWFAELFLQDLDRLILNHKATKHYARYADDITILGSNKRELHNLIHHIDIFLDEHKLKLKDNWQVFRVQYKGEWDYKKERFRYCGRRIDFIGKCYGIGFTTIRKRRSLAFIRQSRRIRKLQERNLPIPFKMAAGFISRSSCLKRTNSQSLRIKYYDTINIGQLKEFIRNYGLEQSRRLASRAA